MIQLFINYKLFVNLESIFLQAKKLQQQPKKSSNVSHNSAFFQAILFRLIHIT